MGEPSPILFVSCFCRGRSVQSQQAGPSIPTRSSPVLVEKGIISWHRLWERQFLCKENMISQLLMVSTRNTSMSHTNPPRMQDQPGGVDSRPHGGALETAQANTDKMEALRLTNQRLIGELEQFTRQMQCPRETRQTQEGHNTTPQEEQPHLGLPREA